MRLKKKNALIALLILVAIITIICLLIIKPWKAKKQSNEENTSNNVTIVTLSPTLPSMIESLSPEQQTTPAPTIEGINPDGLKGNTHIDIPYISQFPELPTGCEITALASALSYYGFSVDKVNLANNYLPMKDEKTSGCFVDYFYGSPASHKGMGCFSPAIIKAANSYLQSNNSSLSASSMCYATIEQMLAEVDAGHTVLVWTSTSYNIPKISFRNIQLDDGTKFAYPYYMTCVVISGYDLAKEKITFVDPTQGEITRDINKFISFYEQMYYQALVIK